MLTSAGLVERGQEQWQFNITLRGQDREEIVQLKHKTDMTGPPGGQLAVRELINAPTVDDQAAPGRTIQAADEIQERGLTRAGRAHERNELAAAHFEIEALQNVDGFVTATEPFLDRFNVDESRGGGRGFHSS